jgi:hypothetical protein
VEKGETMTEKTKIMFLRISYWYGAVLDALFGILFLIPQLVLILFGVKNFTVTFEVQYVMGVGAALMLGWAFLLIWADRKPVERRVILLITVFPLKVIIDFFGILAVIKGTVPIQNQILNWITALILYLLYIYSYMISRDLVKSY